MNRMNFKKWNLQRSWENLLFSWYSFRWGVFAKQVPCPNWHRYLVIFNCQRDWVGLVEAKAVSAVWHKYISSFIIIQTTYCATKKHWQLVFRPYRVHADALGSAGAIVNWTAFSISRLLIYIILSSFNFRPFLFWHAGYMSTGHSTGEQSQAECQCWINTLDKMAPLGLKRPLLIQLFP